MTLSITAGWWLLPLAITFGSLAWAMPIRADERRSGGWFDMTGLESLVRTVGAVIVSLIAWLVWALLT